MLPKTARNKKIHICTLYRWIVGGLRSKDGMIVRLESVKVGGNACTSQEALTRFFERLSGNKAVVTPPTSFGRKRLKQIERAEKELDRLGL